MKKAEAKFTGKVRTWLRNNLGTGAYEIKHTRGKDSFIMRELKDHQRHALIAAESMSGMAFKIPDDGIAFKPFDLFVLKNVGAYVVICYPKDFVVIDIFHLLKWKKKTLPFRNARLIANLTLPLSVL